MLSDIASNRTITRPAGEDVSLLCAVRDATHTEWFRDEPQTPQTSVPAGVKSESLISDDKRHLPDLLLRDVTVNDSGVYTCVGVTPTVHYHLRVLGKKTYKKLSYCWETVRRKHAKDS